MFYVTRQWHQHLCNGGRANSHKVMFVDRSSYIIRDGMKIHGGTLQKLVEKLTSAEYSGHLW